MVKLKSTGKPLPRAYLVGVSYSKSTKGWSQEDSMKELAVLARSAGARVVGSITQRLKRQTQTYLGKGKLEQIKALARVDNFDTLVCDDELTPTQQRNLEASFKEEINVIDRTSLILDVFGRRAKTREGKLQVELARYEYLLPRVAGQWSHLERQRGGMRGSIGARAGPGETQIETDRRIVRKRVSKIQRELEQVRDHRARQRERRSQNNIPVISLLGYTNAGKSTLLNQITKADVPAQNRLFSTLDPITRRTKLPSGKEVLFSDTVGFIQKLPPLVIAAFRATLEEIQESDLILHLVDFSHPNAGAQTDSVENIIQDLGLDTKPKIMVLNKIDLLTAPRNGFSESTFVTNTPKDVQEMFLISALTGEGIKRLMNQIDAILIQKNPMTPRF